MIKLRSMNNIKYLVTLLLFLLPLLNFGQELVVVKGVVRSAGNKEPIADVQVSSTQAKSLALTDEKGAFTIELSSDEAILEVKKQGYNTIQYPLFKRKEVTIYLELSGGVRSSLTYHNAEGTALLENRTGVATALENRDMAFGYAGLDDALVGKFAGIQVQNKGGMPGEGSVINVHGLRSLVAENNPLIVVDGMPYFPDQEESMVINGFSKSMFAAVNRKDIEKVSFLRGAEAAAYGSMGSNGVLFIETSRATDLKTSIEFQTTEGITMFNKRMPVMEGAAFKNFIGDIGETEYNDPLELVEIFPFLKDDPDDNYKYIYNNETAWQDEIYTNAFSTENMLKVRGGDAVAKYALSVGMLTNKGVVENVDQSKYYVRLNSDITVTKRFSAFVTAGFNYGEQNLMEQGLVNETNPMLAAMQKSPLLSIYEQDRFQNNMPVYSTLKGFGISNPVAIINDLAAKNKTYNLLLSMGVNADITSNLKVGLSGGMYYNYTKEDMFIPGKTSKAIAPLMDGLAENTVRSGAGEGINYYLKAYSSYNKSFLGGNDLSATLGYQLMATRKEFDAGSGINTSSDFYRTLGSVNKAHSRVIKGYIDQWNWMNAYLTAKYMYRNQFTLAGSVVADAASSYGEQSNRVFFFPTLSGAWNIKNSLLLDVDHISRLALRGEYGISGNSRFSSKYSRYFYGNVPLRDQGGLVRMGLPNAYLEPEKNITTNVGVDFALLGNRINLSVDLYQEHTKNMLLDKDMPSAYGFSVKYDNAGEVKTKGVDLTLSLNLLNESDFRWSVGGNIATYNSEMISLGDASRRLVSYSDGTELLSEVGETPNLFYGYATNGVIASKQEALGKPIYNQGGVLFTAGDMLFVDQTGDNIINAYDKVVLGDPAPDYYGSFYTNFNYKKWNLFANFTYTSGNEIYNAARRTSESMITFANQSRVVERRWVKDGQTTDIPKAVYGDPMQNSRFSDRWIEDGSYIKLKEITLSYETNRKIWFMNKIQAYITGENLLTWTDYTGFDPEFAYSNDVNLRGMDLGKIPLGRTVKLGLILNF